jgi:predicted aconitase/predicted aconitase with swiveling domain
MSKLIVQADAAGEVLHCNEGLSFWGGVDPETGKVIDVHHPWHGRSLAGKIVLMPSSRGSCSGSGVLLQLALNGTGPAALVFSTHEEVLTLGAVIAARLFQKSMAVVRLSPNDFSAVSAAPSARIKDHVMEAGGASYDLHPLVHADLELSMSDRSCLAGDPMDPATLALEVICTMALASGAKALIDVSRGHIDGCILAHDANLIFAEHMAGLGAEVCIPTTINAISVDRENFATQGYAKDFRDKASRLADAYVDMGAHPTFTCAPYFLSEVPQLGDNIGWSESNAVIFANSVLGARTAKLPDFLDLFVAMTGRAPDGGMYDTEQRRPALIINVEVPEDHDDSLWPLIGWLSGRLAADRVPVLSGLEHLSPTQDDLRAMCAAFGTTSGAPMLHVAGVTPEAELAPLAEAGVCQVAVSDLAEAWHAFNTGPEKVDLVAIGSPHASFDEVRQFADLMDGRHRHPTTEVIVTIGRDIRDQASAAGLIDRLQASGVQLIPDLCWCSITEPVFPPAARTLMTNSGKYAHYAPGLSGRSVRFGSLADCAEVAASGKARMRPPDWLSIA